MTLTIILVINRYISCLFQLLLPLLVQYGIGFETHGQNTLVRVCLDSKQIKGFAVRDFEGVKLHIPTLQQQGINLPITSPGCTNSVESVWSKIHHALFQNHVGNLLYALGLDGHDGWAIVRNELSAVLEPDTDAAGKKLYEYIVQNMMPFKCFFGSENVGGI